MSVAVLWHDGDVTHGTNATDVLNKLCGGWNPNTVIELRSVFSLDIPISAHKNEAVNSAVNSSVP